MAQQINDALTNADCSPQGLDGGLNLKGDPTRLAPPATTRSDNAHYDTVGSVSQLPGFVTQGLNGARHIYNLHARDTGAPSQSGDVLLHGEFADGTAGYTSSFYSLAGTSTQFTDQPVLPFSLKMRNIAGRLNASTDGEVIPNVSKSGLLYCRQEMLPSSGRRKFALGYVVPSSTFYPAYFNYTIGYIDGLTEVTTGSFNLPNNMGSSFADAIGVQGANTFAFVCMQGTTSLQVTQINFDTGAQSSQTITGATQYIGGGTAAFQLVNHAGRTLLAYYTNDATPILRFYDVLLNTSVASPIGGTLTAGFSVFSPYTHQSQTQSNFLVVLKNNSVYILTRTLFTNAFTLINGPQTLPASVLSQSGTPAIHNTGTAIINDSQGGVGGNAQLLITVFRHLPESMVMANGMSQNAPLTNIAVDQLTFVANATPTNAGTLTLLGTAVARFPGGALLGSKAFNSCPSEAYFAGIQNSKQALCLVRSNAYEWYPSYPAGSNYTFGQPSYFLLDHKARIVGRFLESNAGFNVSDATGAPVLTALGNVLFNVPSDQSDDQAALNITLPAWSLVNASFQPPVLVNNAPYTQLAPADCTFAPLAATLTLSNTGQSVPAVQGGPYTVLSGPLTCCHDGFQVAESNYHFATPNIVPAAVTSGSVLGSSGVYYYVALYEFIDAQGQVVRSTPSNPAPLYASGSFYGANVSVPCVPTSKVTGYPNKVRVKLYRSIKNQLLDKNYYLCGRALYPGASDKTINNGDSNNVNITDGYLDNAAITATSAPPPANAINAQPRLYTGVSANNTNAVYSASPPPCFFYQTASKNRVFGLSQQFGQYRIYYTAPSSGTIAPEWNVFNYMPVPPDIGDARSIEALDNAIIIFGTRYVASLTGDGPATSNASGVPAVGENFNPILPVPTPAGVLGTGCPTRIPDGLVYQGLSGVQMFERQSAVTPIGVQVDTFTGRQLGVPGQILGRGITIPSLQSVVWPNSKGSALVYSYLTKKFSLWPLLSGAVCLVQRLDGNVYAAFQPLSGNNYVGPATSGTSGADFGILSASTYSPINLSQNSNAGLVLETPWILPGGSSGAEARVWNACITGTWFGPHTLQVEQAYNYEGYALTRTVDMSVAPRQYQAIIQPLANTRMVSVRYRITLLPLTTLQAGYLMASLADLVLFSAKQQGTVRTSSALRG